MGETDPAEGRDSARGKSRAVAEDNESMREASTVLACARAAEARVIASPSAVSMPACSAAAASSSSRAMCVNSPSEPSPSTSPSLPSGPPSTPPRAVEDAPGRKSPNWCWCSQNSEKYWWSSESLSANNAGGGGAESARSAAFVELAFAVVLRSARGYCPRAVARARARPRGCHHRDPFRKKLP